MAKLNQIIAIEKGIKSRVYGEIGELDKAAQKAELFNGVTRTYSPASDDDDALPSESKLVAFTVDGIMDRVRRLSTEWFQVTARREWTNCAAKADVKIDDEVVLSGVPVGFLLFLEKQLTDLRTMAGRFPVLDPSEQWTKDPNSGWYRTDEARSRRTKKVQRPLVLYPATPEHPAQTQVVSEDVLAGHWAQVRHSGAMPRPDKEQLVDRIEKMLQAVKQAREAANGADEVPDVPPIADAVFGYLLG